MKELLVKDLKVGDIFYYDDRYKVVLGESHRYRGEVYIKVKCIMAPTELYIDDISIGTVSHMAGYIKVKLLVSEGEEVS